MTSRAMEAYYVEIFISAINQAPLTHFYYIEFLLGLNVAIIDNLFMHPQQQKYFKKNPNRGATQPVRSNEILPNFRPTLCMSL